MSASSPSCEACSVDHEPYRPPGPGVDSQPIARAPPAGIDSAEWWLVVARIFWPSATSADQVRLPPHSPVHPGLRSRELDFRARLIETSSDTGWKMPASNVDQLRAQIDRGNTGDKVAFPDPSAAPLGTDDEAAGLPPTPAELRLASMGAIPTLSRDLEGFPWPYLVIAGLVSALILAITYLGSVAQ